MKKKSRHKKLTAAALFLALAAAPIFAQEIRDPNQKPKKFEAAIGVRNIHSYAGRVWFPSPYIVGEVDASTRIKSLNGLLVQGYSWFGMNPQNRNSEMDLGVNIMKDFSLYKNRFKFSLGVQGAIYSIPLRGESETNSNVDITVRVPVSENWGLSFTKDARNLSSYSVGTGYNLMLEHIPVIHKGTVTFKGEFRNSYTFGPTVTASATVGWGPVYVTERVTKGFYQRPEEKPLNKIVSMIEGGLRWQF